LIRVLGIETSCDETAASVVTLDGASAPVIASNIVLSQIEEHAAFGGVVPEIAARAHVEALDGIVEAALADSGVALTDIDAIAATAGPGLVGGLIVGLMTAKAIAAAASKPLIAINHLEGHALTARLTDGLDLHRVKTRYGINVWERFGGELQMFVDEGLLIYDGAALRLTRAGMLLAHEIMAIFIQSTVR